MKMSRLMLTAACGLALSASASGQCKQFTSPVPIEIGDDAPGNLNPSLACVALGGKVYWALDDGDTGGVVTFGDSKSPLDPSNLNPATDGTYYKVLTKLSDPAAGTYTYRATYVDQKGISRAKTGTITLGSAALNVRPDVSKRSVKCGDGSAPTSVPLSLIKSSEGKLAQWGNGGQVDSVCVFAGGHILWNADPDQIKAWTLIFRDTNPIAAPDVAAWGWHDQKAPWHQVTCPGCKPKTPKHHPYQVIAIGTDGKIYRIDPDIIVDPGMNIHRTSNSE